MVKVEISARIHEEARVASAKLRLHPTGDLAALRDQVKEQLRISVLWAEEQEAFIGHIKAYIHWGGEEALMLSTTGGAVEVKGSALPEESVNTTEVGITAIVFGASLELLEDRLEGMAAVIAGQNGEWCTYSHDCEHHHHHDHDHEHEHDHEHDHDHDHDHDEHCSCHDHDHEHHHDHGHGED